MKGFLINAAARRIEPIEYEYRTMKRWLPGGSCIGQVFANDDVLYVDDEALLRPATVAFRLKQRPDGQPMMSHGILTGRDTLHTTLPPAFTATEIEREIEWLTVEEALAWFRARTSDPAVIMTDEDGSRRVVADWGTFVKNLEGQPDGYDPVKVWGPGSQRP